MNRRIFLLTTLGLRLGAGAGGAWAQHVWSSLDESQPIYLEGKVTAVKEQDALVVLELKLPEVLKLPADIESRNVPDQTETVDAKALLAKARLPKRKDPRWTIELAAQSRLQEWKVPPLEPGVTLGVVGYTFAEEKGEALLRAELLFLDDKVVPLRSPPA